MPFLRVLAFLEFFFAVIIVLVVPRGTVTVLSAIAAVCVGVLVAARVPPSDWLKADRQSLWIMWPALFLWAALSSQWSPAPGVALATGAYLGYLTGATTLVINAFPHAPADFAEQSARGLTLALAVGLALLGLDLATDLGLTRWVFSHLPALAETANKHVFYSDGVAVHVSEATSNRRAVYFVLQGLPLVYAVTIGIGVLRGWSGWALLALGYGALFAMTQSLSAQLALVAGLVTLGLARIRPQFTMRMLALGWTAAVLLAVPVALGLKPAGLTNAAWLPASARDRAIIWSVTANEVLHRPLIGIGADATEYAEDPFAHDPLATQGSKDRLGATHAHNAYLQVWYELGAVGALLFLGFGLALLGRISRLGDPVRPFALGQFAVVASVIASSYGIWQPWFLAAIALGAVSMALIDVIERRRSTSSASELTAPSQGPA